jgi:hypothetical protein
MLPGLQKAKVKSRIVLTPEHAKRLMLSLQENVARYERNFGQKLFVRCRACYDRRVFSKGYAYRERGNACH